MIRSSDKTQALYSALVKAQQVVKGAVKNSQNPFYKSSYADLESVWDAIAGPLAENDLAIIQLSDVTEFGPVIATRIIHVSGEWIEGYYPLVAKQPHDPQALGAATSYARRYALAAALGVYQVDDDAEAAMAPVRKVLPGVNNELFCDACPTSKMLVSKFNEHEVYCPKCKSKKIR